MPIQASRLLKLPQQPPEAILAWLTHQSSLTEKLKQQTGDASLKVLHQRWSRTNWWDKNALNITCQEVMQRDILMFSKEKPCWFARTIIPQNTFQEHLSFFDQLQQQSLGVLVFNEPLIQRPLLMHYVINHQCLEYHWLNGLCPVQAAYYYLRLSVFTFDIDTPFYLVEILLPELTQAILEAA